MHFVYLLKSQKDGKLYIGSSSKLRARYIDHQKGRVKSTKNRRPLKLIYYQAFLSKKDATREERYLKSGGHAHQLLCQRVKNSLNSDKIYHQR